jgi:hypothetical protein
VNLGLEQPNADRDLLVDGEMAARDRARLMRLDLREPWTCPWQIDAGTPIELLGPVLSRHNPRRSGAILVELDGESVRVRDEGKRPSCVGIYPDRLNFDASRPK